MKRHSHPHILTPLLLATVALCILSCEKNYRYSPFDGFWRVDEVTDLTTGTTTEGQARLFMSFEYQFVKLSWLPENRTPGFLGYEYIASCKENDGSIDMGVFYKYREEDTLAPADKLASFGIPYGEPSSFSYTFNKDKLTLENKFTMIVLTKY